MEKELIMRICCILFILFTLCSRVHTQEISPNALLGQLISELNNHSSKKIYLYEYLDSLGSDPHPRSSDNCSRHKVDSMKLISLDQPDPYRVMSLLEDIMHSKDASVMEELLEIYDAYLDHFMIDWAQVYKDNYYTCDPILDQYSILATFEKCLTSLSFVKRGYSTNQIFDHYINDNVFYRKLLINSRKRCEIMKEKEFFSTKFKNLNLCHIFYGSIKFNYIDPFFTQLKPNFVEYFTTSDIDSLDQDENYKSRIALYFGKSSIQKIQDHRIYSYYKKNLSKWERNNVDGIIYKYASLNFNQHFSEFLAKRIVEKKEGVYGRQLMQNRRFNEFLLNEKNLPILMAGILKIANNDLPYAASLLKYATLHQAKIISYLEDKSDIIQSLILALNPTKKENREK